MPLSACQRACCPARDATGIDKCPEKMKKSTLQQSEIVCWNIFSQLLTWCNLQLLRVLAPGVKGEMSWAFRWLCASCWACLAYGVRGPLLKYGKARHWTRFLRHLRLSTTRALYKSQVDGRRPTHCPSACTACNCAAVAGRWGIFQYLSIISRTSKFHKVSQFPMFPIKM